MIHGDPDAILSLAPADQFAVAFAVHAGLTTEEYIAAVRHWLATAQHPRFHRPFTELAYEPMLELIAYLRTKGFQVYSVTGSEIDFVRVVNEQFFGIPRDHVIATVLKTKFDASLQPAGLVADPEPLLIDDGDGKAISIHNVLGRRPALAIGNSDGDISMLEYAAGGFAAFVHHDDSEREYAYDRTSPVGKLDKGLTLAESRKWTLISMKNDWERVFRGRE